MYYNLRRLFALTAKSCQAIFGRLRSLLTTTSTLKGIVLPPEWPLGSNHIEDTMTAKAAPLQATAFPDDVKPVAGSQKTTMPSGLPANRIIHPAEAALRNELRQGKGAR